jgi:hypothetical protein
MCLVAVAAILPLMSGCGYSCEDACDDAADEGCEPADCKGTCETNEQLAEDADCTSEWDDLYSCAGDNSDKVCDANAAVCGSESEALGACIATYCTANPTASGCTASRMSRPICRLSGAQKYWVTSSYWWGSSSPCLFWMSGWRW